MLVNAQAWNKVVTLSSKLCRNESPVVDNKINLCYQYRFEGLFRMKMYDDLLHETSGILSEEESKLRKLLHSQVSTESTMVSTDCTAELRAAYNITFSMRIFIVEVKLMTGRSQEVVNSSNNFYYYQ